jgi:hypothetical protein
LGFATTSPRISIIPRLVAIVGVQT